MALGSLLLLVIPLIFLIYKHPDAVMDYLPAWLRPGKQRSEETPAAPSVSPPTLDIHEPDDDNEESSTPKATPQNGPPVPTFTLDANPAAPKPREPSSMLPPPRPRPTNTSLMPPPARPTPPALRAGSGISPLPNRGPPANSQQRAGGSKNTKGKKILLSPGHSPLDWALLAKDPSANLPGVTSFQRVSPAQLKKQNGRKGKPAWTSWGGKVYNLTPYLAFHPGGEAELLRAAGRDAEKLFMEEHPWVNFEGMVGACLVGVLVAEGEGTDEGLDGLD